MRSLIIIIVAFFTLICVMSANNIYINNTAKELDKLAQSLKHLENEERTQRIEEINNLWKKSETLFSLTVSFRETDHLGETILSLAAADKSQNEAEFEKYLLLLIDAIDGVARLEKFSALNIL